MPKENHYENFRTLFTMHLCNYLNNEQLTNVLKALDTTMDDFEISAKKLSIITSNGYPDILKAFIATKAVANLSKYTLKQYNYRLSMFFKCIGKAFDEVEPNDIRTYLFKFKIERGVSDHYLESIRVTIHGFYKWCVDNGHITQNPCANVEKVRYQERMREPLTTYELEKLRLACANIREKAVIDFFFSTGIRVGECAEVKITDINWEDRSVFIHHGKGDKPRITYFNAESEISLREYLKTRNDNTNALFVNVRSPHNALKPHTLEEIVRKVGERVDIHVYPHRLRHTFATCGLHGGMSIENLQKLMGHTKPETTLIYAKLNLNDLQLAHSRVYA